MKSRWLVTGWTWVAIGILWALGWAQIPTLEERTRDSGRSLENCTWQAEQIRLWPVPKREEPGPVACYRKDFTLSAQPRQASITLFPSYPSRHYQVLVNGQLVEDATPDNPGGSSLRTLDLTRVLRAGHNVLAVKGWNSCLRLTVEGIVFGEDGSTLRLITDKTWKGGWDLPEGWDRPDADPTNLLAVESLGVLRWNTDGEFNPPYYGPIQVSPSGLSQPIFDEEKPIQLGITLLNMAGAGKATATLSYEIMDEMIRQAVDQGAVALSPKGKLDLRGRLRHKPLPAGAYRFRFILRAGDEEVDRRDYEIACVGVIKQRLVEGTHYENGMDLKEVWTVDCTQEPKAGEFLAWDASGKEAGTRVEEGPAGKYRAVVNNSTWGTSYFAYRFKVKRLFVPHLAVIEWPDDALRSFQVQVLEGTSMFSDAYYWKIGGFQRGEASVMCVPDHPRTNQVQKLHIIYWPNEEDEAIHVFDLGAPAPAAASRITIYEITNDLPALRIADGGDRLTGYHSERGPFTIAETYYAGPVGEWFPMAWAGVDHPEFYRNWYTTTENMIKQMRFSGQNLYLMGHFMYNGVLFPSQRYIYAQSTYRGGDAVRDYSGLILRMFGRNGMNLISGVEYANTPDLLTESPATEEEVRNGAPTLKCVGKNGRFATPHGSFGGVNYFHPRVQQSILTVVDELVDLYKDYPAWKGISFILSRAFGPMGHANWTDDPLDWGYEDYTIDLFQKETGIKIPVSPKDPERFAKRYRWIMDKAKEPWLHWRCQQYTRLYRKLRDRLVKGRPDLNLYLLCGEPLRGTPSIAELNGHFDDPQAMRQVVKTFGFDPEALKKERGMVIGTFYLSPGTRQSLAAKGGEYRELNHSQSWSNLFANDGKGGAYIWAGFTEYHYAIPKAKWLFERSLARCCYPWPPGDYINDTFVNVLARSNPTWMPHTWIDCNMAGGHLQEMRLFARAYRSLPNGKYRRLTGNGLDKNIWVERTTAQDAEYAYAANADWWEAEVTLTFAPGVKVHDLIKDQPVVLKGGKWSFHLGPYQVQTFRIAGGGSARGSAIIGATVTPPRAAEAATREALERGEKVISRARARETELRDIPGWKRVGDLEKTVPDIQALEKAGDLSRAYEMATSWPFEQAQQQVVNEALEAIPFLVLGPFGDPKDTEGAGSNMNNPFVTADYQGIETPYLGESQSPDLSTLVPNFRPDRSRTYQVYPGREATWQEAVKTYHFSFYGKAHSEYPLWMVAYAYTEIYSPEERDATIWVGSDHAIWVWCNDRLAIRHGGHGTPGGGQRVTAPDQNRGEVRLQKGWNRVLVKAVQRSSSAIGETRIFFRITDPKGDSLDDLRFRVPKLG